MCQISCLLPNLVTFSCYTVNILLEKWLMRCDTKRAIWWDLYNKHISIFCIKHMGTIFRTLQVKVIQNGVKPFLNETVKKSCFHVDLYMLKHIWHFQCSVDTRNRVKMKKILEKRVWCSILFQPNLANSKPVDALISTVGKPSSCRPQTTFTVNHKPQFYEKFKGFVEVTLYNINKWGVVWVGCH